MQQSNTVDIMTDPILWIKNYFNHACLTDNALNYVSLPDKGNVLVVMTDSESQSQTYSSSLPYSSFQLLISKCELGRKPRLSSINNTSEIAQEDRSSFQDYPRDRSILSAQMTSVTETEAHQQRVQEHQVA